MIERLEILSAAAMKSKKFKGKCEGRLAKLEAAQLQNVQKEEFLKELKKAEGRMNTQMRDQIARF